MDSQDQTIKKLHPDPMYFLNLYFFGILFIIAGFFFFWYLFVVGFLIIFLAEVARRAETFYILNSGVARGYKLFSTSREFAEYEKIQDIKVKQSFVDNLLGIGSVYMNTAGSGGTEVNFHGIKNPYEIESLVRENMK
ncbi:MAG: PH domain-containing protein [Candidatus Paceibacterota bacterium]|jgi:uncharacterized membrane protein YdbT with pleckstrin-like domain